MQNFFNKAMTIISILTAFGVFMHDGRVDKATTTSLTYARGNDVGALDTGKTITAKFIDFLKVDSHTHPDHNAAKSLLSAFTYQSPSIPPRNQEQKRHLLQQCEPRGRHAFDNIFLPIVA